MEPEDKDTGYFLDDPSKIRSFSNLDLWDTLNGPTVSALWEGKVGPLKTAQIMLTAFATLEAENRSLRKQLYDLQAEVKKQKEEKLKSGPS